MYYYIKYQHKWGDDLRKLYNAVLEMESSDIYDEHEGVIISPVSEDFLIKTIIDCVKEESKLYGSYYHVEELYDRGGDIHYLNIPTGFDRTIHIEDGSSKYPKNYYIATGPVIFENRAFGIAVRFRPGTYEVFDYDIEKLYNVLHS